jgi:hypothetical protein
MVTAASLTQRLMRAGSCRKRLLHTAAFPRTPQRAWLSPQHTWHSAGAGEEITVEEEEEEEEVEEKPLAQAKTHHATHVALQTIGQISAHKVK